MTPATIGVISTACVFGGALIGIGLQRLLPKHHLSRESQDVVKLGAGVIATVTALVLGLLVSSAKSSFDAMNARITQMSANIIILDRTLAEYGPEAKNARESLRWSVETTLHKIWPEERIGVSAMAAIERGGAIEAVQAELRQLAPRNDEQRQLLAQARQLASDASQSRWMLIEEAQNELPTTFLVVLVLWLTILFLSFGLFAPRNATVAAALLIGACTMSAAIFLILEMNRPLDGFIKVSSAPSHPVSARNRGLARGRATCKHPREGRPVKAFNPVARPDPTLRRPHERGARGARLRQPRPPRQAHGPPA